MLQNKKDMKSDKLLGNDLNLWSMVYTTN